MTRDEAAAEVRRIMGDAAALLSPEDMAAVLDAATTDGDTDPWLAAAEAADLLGIRSLGTSGVTRWTSEGTTVERRAADWFGMRDALRAKSPTATGAGLSVVSVDQGGGDGGRVGYDLGPGYWAWDGGVPIWYGWRTP